MQASKNLQRFRHLKLLSAIFIVCFNTCCSQFPGMVRDDIFAKPSSFKSESALNKTRFNDEEKRRLLWLHNSYRSIVWPTATAMPELEWDTDLEQFAWNHAQACTGAHSNRTMVKKYTDDPRTWRTWQYMPENLYYRQGPNYSLEQAMWMFWEEGSKYDVYSGNCTHSNTCAHYVSAINAASSKVGCAINICDKFTESTYPTPAVFLACSYDGVYLKDTKPYVPGPTCNRCTKEDLGADFQFCRNRLCISPRLLVTKEGFDGDITCIQLDIPGITTPTTSTTSTTTTTPSTTTTVETTASTTTEEITTPTMSTTTEEITTPTTSTTTEEITTPTTTTSTTTEEITTPTTSTTTEEITTPTTTPSTTTEESTTSTTTEESTTTTTATSTTTETTPTSTTTESTSTTKPTSPTTEKSTYPSPTPTKVTTPTTTETTTQKPRIVSKAPSLRLSLSQHYNILSFSVLSMFIVFTISAGPHGLLFIS